MWWIFQYIFFILLQKVTIIDQIGASIVLFHIVRYSLVRLCFYYYYVQYQTIRKRNHYWFLSIEHSHMSSRINCVHISLKSILVLFINKTSMFYIHFCYLNHSLYVPSMYSNDTIDMLCVACMNIFT